MPVRLIYFQLVTMLSTPLPPAETMAPNVLTIQSGFSTSGKTLRSHGLLTVIKINPIQTGSLRIIFDTEMYHKTVGGRRSPLSFGFCKAWFVLRLLGRR